MFSERLKSLRIEKDLLQKDIANILNISTSAYGFYEQNKREPDYKTLTKLAEFFNVSIDYLLGKSNIKNPYKDEIISKIPQKFTDPVAAREYVSKHEIFGANGFDPNKMTDNEILEFANALQEQMEMVMYKFKK